MKHTHTHIYISKNTHTHEISKKYETISKGVTYLIFKKSLWLQYLEVCKRTRVAARKLPRSQFQESTKEIMVM